MEAIEELTVQEVQARRNKCAARVDELLKKQLALALTLGDIADEVRAGKVERASEAPGVHTERSETDRRLKTAQEDLKLFEGELQAAMQAENRKRFDKLATEAREARTDFIRFFRLACLRFGTYYSKFQEAEALAADLGCPDGLGRVWPQDTNVLSELRGKIDPYEAWENVEPTVGYGWNARLRPVTAMRLRIIPSGENQ